MDKCRKTVDVNNKKCDATATERFNGLKSPTRVAISVIYMVVTMFFWYFSLNNIWFYLYNTTGFTTIGSLYGTTISVISGLVYAYLLYEVFKIEKFNLTRSTMLMMIVISLAIISILLFPIPYD